MWRSQGEMHSSHPHPMRVFRAKAHVLCTGADCKTMIRPNQPVRKCDLCDFTYCDSCWKQGCTELQRLRMSNLGSAGKSNSAKSNERGGEWACVACCFVNALFQRQCEVCGQLRELEQEHEEEDTIFDAIMEARLERRVPLSLDADMIFRARDAPLQVTVRFVDGNGNVIYGNGEREYKEGKDGKEAKREEKREMRITVRQALQMRSNTYDILLSRVPIIYYQMAFRFALADGPEVCLSPLSRSLSVLFVNQSSDRCRALCCAAVALMACSSTCPFAASSLTTPCPRSSMSSMATALVSPPLISRTVPAPLRFHCRPTRCCLFCVFAPWLIDCLAGRAVALVQSEIILRRPPDGRSGGAKISGTERA